MTKSLMLACLLFAGGMAVIAQQKTEDQSINDLEKKRKEKLEEIAFTQKLLDQTDEEQRQNLGYLIILKRQIRNRQNLINSIDNEVSILTTNIDDSRELITALQNDVTALKTEYANMIYLAYRNHGSYHYLAFIFASKSINDAWKRLKLVRYYLEYRKQQVRIIEATQKSLASKMESLGQQVSEKEELIAKLEIEKRKLMSDRGQKSKLLSELKEKEEDYRSKLRNDKKLAKELDETIEEIIRREAQKKAAANIDDSDLSELFASNKRQLNWPVQGVVSSSFGNQAHPTIPNVYISNYGVDISTEKDALAKCVFNGTVIRVVYIPGANYAIIVQHGDYYTVYKNLINVSVTSGDQVDNGQPLGQVSYDPKKGSAELHFEIRKNTEKLNPELWLKNK